MSLPLEQRTFELGVQGVLPPELEELLSEEALRVAQTLIAKTIGRQLHNYGYLLAGLGKAMCADLAQRPLPTTAASAFKATALRAHFDSSANFMNTAYELVNNTWKGHHELQRLWDGLWETLHAPEMVSSWENFLFTGFSSRHLLSRLQWKNWAWARQFIRGARNKLDESLPPELRRHSIPQNMATAGTHVVNWVQQLPQLPLTPLELHTVITTAVKYSLVPMLWSETPLPLGLFPATCAPAAETLRVFIAQNADAASVQCEITTQIPLRTTSFTLKELQTALQTLIHRVQAVETQLSAEGRNVASFQAVRRKYQLLYDQPELLAVLAGACWVPQTRLIQRWAHVLQLTTKYQKWVGILASLIAHLVVTSTLPVDPSTVTREGVERTIPMSSVLEAPQLPLPFHSAHYYPHAVAFPLLENKYTFHYPACDTLAPVLCHEHPYFDLRSNKPLSADQRLAKLAQAIKAATNPVFQAGLTAIQPYLMDELPWDAVGSCHTGIAADLRKCAPYEQLLATAPTVRAILPPYLLRKLQRGASVKCLQWLPPRTPARRPILQMTVEGTIPQLYRRIAYNPALPLPQPGDLPQFPVLPVDHVLSVLQQQWPTLVQEYRELHPTLATRVGELHHLVGASCLAFDLNRLSSDWALTVGAWAGGVPLPIGTNYQHALNAQFCRWASKLDILDRDAAYLSRKLARARQRGMAPTTEWYHRRVKELRCLHRKRQKLKRAAYLYAADCLYLLIMELRPQYVFYEQLRGLSPRGKRGSLAKLLTWMLTRVDDLISLVRSWCQAAEISTLFRAVDPRNTSKFHHQCGGRLHRRLGHWDQVPCDKCGQQVNSHENATFNLCQRGLGAELRHYLQSLPHNPP